MADLRFSKDFKYNLKCSRNINSLDDLGIDTEIILNSSGKNILIKYVTGIIIKQEFNCFDPL